MNDPARDALDRFDVDALRHLDPALLLRDALRLDDHPASWLLWVVISENGDNPAAHDRAGR